MRTTGLPTIRELIAEGAATLPEPFRRAALLNWVTARRPDVGIASVAAHIQAATANAGHPADHSTDHDATDHDPADPRPEPLLVRVQRGLYARYRGSGPDAPVVVPAGRVVLIGSSGEIATGAGPAAGLFGSAGFGRARAHAAGSGAPWFVLSVKHGLLDPDDVVGPYEGEIGDRSAGYRAAWGAWVVAQLGERLQLDGLTVEVHGGVDFAQPLRGPLARRGAVLELALPGAWQDEGTGWPAPPGDPGASGHAHDSQDDASPVAVALGKLLSLVTRHRPPAPPSMDAASG